MPDLITVDFTRHELSYICGALASELQCDMPVSRDDSDFVGILGCWRAYSSHYVPVAVLSNATTMGGAEATRDMHDRTADLLEKLLERLSPEEVAHV